MVIFDKYLGSYISITGEGNGNPLQDSYLEKSMEWGAWWTTVHEVTKSQARLSDLQVTQRGSAVSSGGSSRHSGHHHLHFFFSHSPSVSLFPWGSFHEPLIHIHQRADRMKTAIIENSSDWSHGPQPCLTQWNYVHKVLFVPSKSLFPQTCISSGIRSHHFRANRWGNSGKSGRLCFWGAPKSLQMVTAATKFTDTYSLEQKVWPT